MGGVGSDEVGEVELVWSVGEESELVLSADAESELDLIPDSVVLSPYKSSPKPFSTRAQTAPNPPTPFTIARIAHIRSTSHSNVHASTYIRTGSPR